MVVRQMSDKEILRGQIMAQLVDRKLDQKSAALRLSITVRQVKRLKHSFLKEGIAGLISKKRGQASHRRTPARVSEQVVALIGARYADFGPTLATEKLSEVHGIHLSVETVRQHMIAAGYWKPTRGQSIRTHPIRDRRPRRGELIQIDGSPHDWFEGRAPYCCLLVFIDDATGELMDLQFVDVENTLGYMAALERYIVRHGVPAALYSDRHSIFRVNPLKSLPTDAQTQFARALEQLGIEGIQAHSPQAKGRVERANQTLQDRLIKEMRLLGINDQVSANQWLPEYMADFNRRFAVEAAVAEDAHVPYRGQRDDLQGILSIQEVRHLSKNLSCQFEKTTLQIQSEEPGLVLRGAKVTIHRHSNGGLGVRWKTRILTFERLQKPAKQFKKTEQSAPIEGKELNAHVDAVIKKRGHNKPINDIPWEVMIIDGTHPFAQNNSNSATR